MEPEECTWTRRSISSHVATFRYRSEWTWIQIRGWDGAGVLGWDRSDRMSPTSFMWVIEGVTGHKRASDADADAWSNPHSTLRLRHVRARTRGALWSLSSN